MRKLWKVYKLISFFQKGYFWFSLFKNIVKTIDNMMLAMIPFFILSTLKKSDNEIYTIFIYMGFWLIIHIVSQILDTKKEKMLKNILLSIKNKFSLKTMKLPYSMLEDLNLNVLRQRAERALFNMNVINDIFNNIEKLETSIFFFVSSMLILDISNYYLIIIYLLALSPIIFLSIKRGKIDGEYEIESAKNSWRSIYFISEAIMPFHQMDFRIFKYNELMMNNINELLIQEKGIETKKINRKLKYDESILLIKGISSVIILFIAFLLSKTISFDLAFFTLIAMIVPRAADSLSEMVVSYFELKEKFKQFEPVDEFLNLREHDEKQNSEKIKKGLEFKKIEFKNVYFTYPGNKIPSLTNVSFEINRGEKISIVGPNLSGKSTLVKLICRFYKPDSGSILLNNVDINDISIESYYEMISTIFQDFSFFPFTIGENISLKSDYDVEAINSYIKEVGLKEKIEGLQSKLDTYMDKAIYEDSTSFSGGQFQKLAMVRAMYKKSDIMIFDEPTSALDPIAESHIIKEFNNITESKTVLFITHRMSTCSLSDKVLLLNKGEVEDFMPHSELLKKNELYKDLYYTQAKYFKIKDKNIM